MAKSGGTEMYPRGSVIVRIALLLASTMLYYVLIETFSAAW
jgi:hypothetical protein